MRRRQRDESAAATPQHGAVCGLNTTAIRLTAGPASLSVCSHLLIANSKLVKPVRSPPGLARFGTKPLPSGSVTCTPLAAWRLLAQLREHRRAVGNDYVGRSGHHRGRLAAQAVGIVGRPAIIDAEVAAIDPAAGSRSPCKDSDPHSRLWIVGGAERHQYTHALHLSSIRCALAASGHAAAAPPSSVMKSRRDLFSGSSSTSAPGRSFYRRRGGVVVAVLGSANCSA
jgi:hypothetical protein